MEQDAPWSTGKRSTVRSATGRPPGSGGQPDMTPTQVAQHAQRNAVAAMDLPGERALKRADILVDTFIDHLTVRGAEMANALRVTLEIGPKGKKVAAVAPDWPGLERGAKTEEAAIERLQSYLPRYAQVAKLAGLDASFAANTTVDVIERYSGTSSTDFWGISFAFSGIDRQALSSEELERELTLVRACWAFFDDVRLRVSAELQKGPRRGGRDRDHVVGHTIRVEQEWAGKVGVPTPQDAPLTDEGLQAYRDAYCGAIRAYYAEGKMARTWPLRYLIRHTAYHTLDHAWEMEDKDLTAGVR